MSVAAASQSATTAPNPTTPARRRSTQRVWHPNVEICAYESAAICRWCPVSVKRALVAFLGAAGAVAVMLLLGARPAGADTVSDEQQFVVKINQLRASKGLSQLTVDANLTTIARTWAQSMAAAGDISHNPSVKELVTSTWLR